MSWLSDRLGTTGKTPSFIKAAGNLVGGAVVKAIPGGGGSFIDRIFNLSGTQGSGSGVGGVIQETGANLESQLDRAGTMAKLETPIALGAVALLAYFAFKD